MRVLRNLSRLRAALEELDAQPLAVPPLDAVYPARGHAAHFRCRRSDVAGLRIDLMSWPRGVDGFKELWKRRTTIEVEGETILADHKPGGVVQTAED